MSDRNSYQERVDQYLTQIGWGKYQTILFWICGAGWAADNMWLLLSTVLINELPGAWGLTETESALVGTILMIGFLVGAYIWGYTSDKYGRLFSFRKTLLLAAVAAIGAALSVDLAMLLIFCFIAGIGIGGDIPVDGSVFIEFCPAADRWRMVALSAVCAMGAVIVPLFAYIFVVADLPQVWRLVTAVNWVLNFLFWLPRYYVYETPKFLATKNRWDEAEDVLRQVARINQKDFRRISDDLIEMQAPSEQLILREKEDNSKIKDNTSMKSQFKRLFGPELRKVTLLLLGVWFFSAFAWAGYGMFVPILMERSGAVSGRAEVYKSMCIQQCTPVVAQLIGTWLVTTFLGRKWTQAISLILSGVCLYFFLISTTYASLIVTSSAFFFFLLMAYGALYTITPESYPTDIRNTGLGLCSTISRVGMLIAPLLSGVFIDSMGIDAGGAVAVVLYSACVFVAGVLTMLLRETKDLNIE